LCTKAVSGSGLLEVPVWHPTRAFQTSCHTLRFDGPSVEPVTWGHVHGVSQQVRKTQKHLGSAYIVPATYESPPNPCQPTTPSMDSSETDWRRVEDSMDTHQRHTEDSPKTSWGLAGSVLCRVTVAST